MSRPLLKEGLYGVMKTYYNNRPKTETTIMAKFECQYRTQQLQSVHVIIPKYSGHLSRKRDYGNVCYVVHGDPLMLYTVT